jgi:hypothetical protein
MNTSTYFILFVILAIIIFIVIYYSFFVENITGCSEAQSQAMPEITDSNTLIQNTLGNLPISKYTVFSSWNTACSGKFVSTQQILNVLSTGCRMVDFPITVSGGNYMIYSPVFNNDASYNSIPLVSAIQSSVNNAFQNYITVTYQCSGLSTSPTYTMSNYTDPLFIQLRFVNPDTNTTDLLTGQTSNKTVKISISDFDQMAELIGYNLKGRQYQPTANTSVYKMNINTYLNELQQKVVLIIDTTSFDGGTLTNFQGSKLSLMTNLTIGSGVEYEMNMQIYKILLELPPKTTTESTPSITQLSIATPEFVNNVVTEPTVEQVMKLAAIYKVQFVPFVFYQTSSLLTEYIQFFQKNKSAFISLDTVNNLLIQESQQAVMR